MCTGQPQAEEERSFPARRSDESSSDSDKAVVEAGSRFGHSVRRPGQFVCPNSDSVCPNSPNSYKKYLTVVMFRFLLLFFAY